MKSSTDPGDCAVPAGAACNVEELAIGCAASVNTDNAAAWSAVTLPLLRLCRSEPLAAFGKAKVVPPLCANSPLAGASDTPPVSVGALQTGGGGAAPKGAVVQPTAYGGAAPGCWWGSGGSLVAAVSSERGHRYVGVTGGYKLSKSMEESGERGPVPSSMLAVPKAVGPVDTPPATGATALDAGSFVDVGALVDASELKVEVLYATVPVDDPYCGMNWDVSSICWGACCCSPG
jgi:hypothetical protein